MQLRLLLALCLLSLPAAAQNKGTDNTANPQQGSVPKGRQPAMERHTRTTWRYHSGPRRAAVPADSTRTATSSKPPSTTDAAK